MITVEKFEEMLTWLAEVTGQAVKRTTARALWKELMNTDLADFEGAIKELAYSDEKVNLNNIFRRIARLRGIRLEKEAMDRSIREDEELRQWFKNRKGNRSECINSFQCGQCRRTYCDIVSQDCTLAIKSLLAGEINGKQANKMLADKFHGIGFEAVEPF